MRSKILTKKQYYDLAIAGMCGNAPRMWRTAEELVESGYDRTVGVRFLVPGSKLFLPRVSRDNIADVAKNLTAGTFIISEIPRNYAVFQGEFSFISDYELDYSREPVTLREAMLDGKSKRVTGLAALNLLRDELGDREYEELMQLLHDYTISGAAPVIEFSKFPEEIGIFPGRSTLIWEVRHY